MTTAQDDQQCNAPEGWQLHHPQWGFMGVDSTPGGRVVRLADVLLHLEQCRGLPRGEALAELLSDIEKQPESLVILSRTHSARPVSGKDRFGFAQRTVVAKEVAAGPVYGSPEWRNEFRRVQSGGVPRYSVKQVDQVRPGLPALVARVRSDWLSRGLALDDEKTHSAWLGVLLRTAHDLWGFGAEVEKPLLQAPAAALKVVNVKPPGDVTGWLALVDRYMASQGGGRYRWRKKDQIAAFLEEERRNQAEPGTARKGMAAELGISPEALRKQIQKGAELHAASQREAEATRFRGNSVFNC